MAKTLVIPADEFAERLMALMEEVASSGEEIVVTRNGEPLVRVVREQRPANGRTKIERPDISGMVLEIGDIVSPIGEKWEADA
ncbi:MAG TPA: type II toxin-antitoxin system prevent-host-death family antitoxin [Tepidiformaceae bacterium]|nr:type II toxin-antitoxin system prevent-host-death family antitoxin [Tepidiformaceae bacterium]